MTEAGRITMRDVARAVGVSTMTVSRALSGQGQVSPERLAAIREAADRLGYVYDATAPAFRAQRSGFVAVTLPSVDNANFAATHRALSGALAETGLQILLGITGYSVEEEERLVRQMLARRPEAVVLTGGTHTGATRALLSASASPVIEIWDLPGAPLGHVVGFSNAGAMRPVVEHLAARGRRRLAFLGASGDTDHRGAERRRGVVEAAASLGLPPVRMLDAGPAPVSMSEGARAVRALGGGLSALDAIVCVSDPVAFGALTACRSLGFDVPRDVAITGFGAFEIASVCEPTLTTVDVGAEEIGRLAGRQIARLLDRTGDDPAARVLTSTVRLLPGGSA